MSGFFSLRFFVSLTCSTYHQRVARISSGYPSHSTLAAITKELWTDLHSFELLEVVALSLRSHVEDNLGRTASWEEMKKKTNVYQQYLIAFVESDSAINADGLYLGLDFSDICKVGSSTFLEESVRCTKSS